jgi:hypothetical protein
MKKASVNGQPSLLQLESRMFAQLPDFAAYLETELNGLIGAIDTYGKAIVPSWQPILETDRVHIDQDLTMV